MGQYIKENGFDDYVMEQAMLNSGPGSVKMIPGLLPPPPMPPLPDIDLDADIGYKNLPPLPPLNGKLGYAGIILQAPALYDTRTAIDVELSSIEAATQKPGSEQHRSRSMTFI